MQQQPRRGTSLQAAHLAGALRDLVGSADDRLLHVVGHILHLVLGRVQGLRGARGNK
jgi:hypothetical protein